MTNLEEQVKGILESIGFLVKHFKNKAITDYANTFYYQVPTYGMVIDFASPNRIAIEVNGEYWHANIRRRINTMQLKNKMRDENKSLILSRSGWNLIVINESALQDRNMTDWLRKMIWGKMEV